ncbi:S1C family serine protease [Nocardioides zhouii]|uniref:PDZ domain-containing protein n=1 Tax=Nocardioides zhouii TaxID=1168729 RepID=A0A4Q2T3J2_9ACTN|nr:trypsin-like peptidase domain-containing protein [Nocardioides zhouii]RYC13316.1 PDZ domain-containing protein [Nocardioides zhouii]
MSDEHKPDGQTPEQPHDQSYDASTGPSAAPEPPAPEEPTQPLAGWPDGRAYGRPGSEDIAPAGPPPYGSTYGQQQPPQQQQQQPAPPQGQGPYAPAAPTVPFAPPGGPGGPGGQGESMYFGPGPYPPAGYPRQQRPRPFPLWAWPAIAALALVVGVLGGLAGGALQDELASQRGTVDNGLDGVRTQSAAPLDADNGSVPAVAQALLPSTVQIVAEFDGQAAGATGSGFVLDREGHIVTNNHVVASAAEDDGPIVVIDHEGKRHEATVVGRSAVYDLAVLDVEDGEGLEPAALGRSQVLRVGDPVIAFGAPLGLSQTVTSGIVSALDRPVTTSGESDDESSYINAVQTDAAINPGNSGGPLVNLAGEVVGVNSAIATNGGSSGEAGNIGVGFAIPIEQVITTVDQILRTGKAEYPVIGAQVRTGGEPDSAGATITEVMPDTPAERAGLLKDDIITAVDDKPVNDGIALIVAIRTHLPGDTVEMSVIRGGDEQVVEVELDGKVG